MFSSRVMQICVTYLSRTIHFSNSPNQAISNMITYSNMNSKLRGKQYIVVVQRNFWNCEIISMNFLHSKNLCYCQTYVFIILHIFRPTNFGHILTEMLESYFETHKILNKLEIWHNIGRLSFAFYLYEFLHVRYISTSLFCQNISIIFGYVTHWLIFDTIIWSSFVL